MFMQERTSGDVFKKASSEMFFAEYGRNPTDCEEPTVENKRVIDLFDPVDAMSLNREKDRVVVSGIRGVLQIIKIQNSRSGLIEGPSIVKDLDMRVYRKGKVNILYSAQNVKWNQLYDQYIATTSSNGSIVCWNISRRNKSVFKSHERSATCLDWHATTPYILVSGSRDCTVRSYDMRVKDNHQLTFSDRNCESIRDVAMCKAPGFDDYFFTGDDGGVLRLWDLRQTKRWVFQKVAHRSFVSTLSLNPHKRTLIATGGGRDKMVKIWEWTGPELNRVSVVETTAPLGRVVWRPDKPYHLATCASVNETTVHVWDVRRPYLPYVTYDEHRDSVTDACWPSNDFDVFLTCGKDGLVVLHNIDSGHAPISFACDVAFDITPDGTMGLAVNSEIHAKNDAELEARAPSNGKKTIRQIPYESFNKPIKSLVAFGVPEALTHSLPPVTFYQIAEKYIIGGVEIMQLCETNSKVARKAGLEHVAQTWRLVEALCEQARIQEEYDKLSAEEKERIIRAWAVRKKELAEEGRRWLANLNDHYRDDVKKQVTQRLENTQHVTAFLKFSSSSESEDGSDNEKIGEIDNNKQEVDRMAPNVDKNLNKKKKRKKKTAAATDFYFGAGEANFKGGKQEILHHNEFMGLRAEAYELRDEEKERRFFCKARKQPTNAEEYEELQKELQASEADFQAWSPMLEIYRLLLYHAEQGDMQTCATISMVCGKRLLDAVDPYTVNGWIQCYMEMLDRLELFLVCAKIRKYCPLDSISSASRENTTIQLAHADCDALIVNGRCTKCESLAQADCTVCRFAIVGMTFQCNVCGHCMHTNHAFEWFQKTNECAFIGCPCTCGENTWPDMERTFIGNDEVKKGHRKFNHVEPIEPTSSRVDASRLDTDSEESPDDDDMEWSPATNMTRDRFGDLPQEEWTTPWARYLVRLCKQRYSKEDDPEVKLEKDSSDADNPFVLSPTTQKEVDEGYIRGALLYNLQDNFEVQKGIIEPTPEKKGKCDVDREDFVEHYLASDEEIEDEECEEYDEEEEQRRPLEQIEEEDEEMDEEDVKEYNVDVSVEPEYDAAENQEETKVQLENGVELEENGGSQDIVDEEDSWDDLYGDDYINSIGPIGLEPYQTADIERECNENDRVTSPTFLSAAVMKHLKEVKRYTFDDSSGSSQSNEDEESIKENVEQDKAVAAEIFTEREGRVKKAKPAMSYKDRALQILNMSRDELKKKKAKKRKKQIDDLYRQMITEKKSHYSVEVSADEFIVSSSLSDDDASSSTLTFSSSTQPSSTGSSTSELFIPVPEVPQDPEALGNDEGYKAESEGSSSESSSHEELSAQPELRLPTPLATGDLYLKRESPSPVVTHKTKKYKKVRNSMVCSSADENEHSDGYAENYFICIEGITPSSSSSRLSTPPVSPVPSLPSSHFSSPPLSPTGSPPPSLPDESTENDIQNQENLEGSKDPDPNKSLNVPGDISLPPSRKTSSIIPPDTPIIEPPTVTSYANPIFARLTGRPPRSRPVTICGDGYDNGPLTNGNGIHSAPGTSTINHIFECSSSLPTKPNSSSVFNCTENLVENGNHHNSIPAMHNTSETKLSNGTQNHLLVTELPKQPPKSYLIENNLFGSPSLHFPNNDFENKLMQKRPESPHEKTGDTTESDLFSSNGEEIFDSPSAQELSDEENAQPFFPLSEDIPILPRNRHPWENEEQYQERLQKEKEEEEDEEKEKEAEKLKEQQSQAETVLINKHTPMMRELARRKRRIQMKLTIPPKPKPFAKPMPPLKRVKFSEEDYDSAMKIALENLKLEAPCDISSNSDYEEFVREKEVCLPCKHEMKENKKEKEYIQWLKNISKEGQMFFAKSLSDPCAVFQLSHLDSYITDVEEARRTASHLLEFIKMFYFIKWEELLFTDNEFMLKEVYELWKDYRKKRPRVCRTHFRDYQFRFFAYSIATKMKQHMIMSESPLLKQSLLSYDWLHIKPCVNTLDDYPHEIDEMMDTVVRRNPNWTIEEKKAANRYWDLFGEVPLHIETTNSIKVPPASEERLDIVDDSNYWTKKMLKNVMYNSRNYDIKLTYTKRKKHGDLFYVQDRSKKVLNREWQMRLDKMINEARHVDLSTSSFRINPHDKLIYTTDENHPWPICQFDTGDHYVTVQPIVSKRYTEFKSRVRRKFNFRRHSKPHKNSKHIEITTDELRKLPSFKKFEPKLQKAKDFKKMMSKHYRVVDRAIVENKRHLYTIVEEEDEVGLVVQMLENRPKKRGQRALDPEDVFAERRDQRERKEKETLAKMEATRYRKELANTDKLESEKMKVMKKHWMPELRKKIRVARKVIELGRLMVEEDVRKWMEYQYELLFVKKTFRKKSIIKRKGIKYNVPMEWFDAVERLNYKELVVTPPYVKPLPKLKTYVYSPGPPVFNSSSDSEDYDVNDEKPVEDDDWFQFETQPKLSKVAAKLQVEIREKLELADELVDSEWEYSDDSSVSTWFNGDTDDIVNRLVNSDYMDERMMLKERVKGALGKKLWEVLEEREDPESSEDEEENNSFDLLLEKMRIEKETKDLEWLESNGDDEDIGNSDGKRKKELSIMEERRDSLKHEKREERKNEMEQVRWFFKKFALDHSYTSEPYVWNEELRGPISSLHSSELRRVSNRIHKEMKEEYEAVIDEDEMITKIIPADETSIQYKLINFLLFRKNEESFEECSKHADECSKMLKPIQQYEMFFGREGAYDLKTIVEDVMLLRNIRSSFNFIIRNLGENMQISESNMREFLKLWWYNSRDTLERFITCCEETIEIEENIVEDLTFWYYCPVNMEIARETFDKLEIASIMNEIIYFVDQYVEETEILFRDSTTAADKKAFAMMNVWEWNDLKFGYPEWRESDVEAEEETELISSDSTLSEASSIPKDSNSKSRSSSLVWESGTNSDASSSESYKSPIQIRPRNEKPWELEEPEQYDDITRRYSIRQGRPNQQMMSHYSAVYDSIKEYEAEKRQRHAEEVAKRTMARWELIERQQRWEVEDMERRVHDYLMKELAVKDNEEFEENSVGDQEAKNWKDIIEKSEDYKDISNVAMYGKKDLPTTEVLEMCGLPLSLDNQMFYIEMKECQSAATSVADADEFCEVIEKGFDDEGIDMDAQSYSSFKHVYKHELYFQRNLDSRRVPSCVVFFTPDQFFEDPTDSDVEFRKWKRIIEASECPFSFNKLVMRERLLRKCREHFQDDLLEKYFAPNERKHPTILTAFHHCFILVVVDTELNPWDCRVVSQDDVSKAATNRITHIRKTMVEDSQEQLIKWLALHKIDIEVYSRCPVIHVCDEGLTLDHASQMSNMLIEDHIQESWLMIKRKEGVRALDTIIRMPPPPKHKLDVYKVIFRPIYDAWYKVWKFENAESMSRTPVKRKFDAVREYLHKARMIVNYAHQHYRMKRFDSLMSKDPTEFQLVDRSDVPSASLFDSLDAAVSKFCNEDSPHLDEASKQVVKDTLIQLATGKIPYFTTNYFGGYDYTENIEMNNDEDEENDDDKLPILRNTDIVQPVSPNAKYLELEDCEEEITWLRNMYEETDFHRRRFMAVLLFEIAQKAMYRYAPNMADFQRAQKRFEHLLTLHGKQRPLLDMMITKVRGTYFMPLETNLFLYNSKLITFGELVDSEVHPNSWKNRKESLEGLRRQTPLNPQAMNEFLEMQPIDSDSDSGSEIHSDTSSSLGGSTESLNSSKKGKRARKTLNKAQRELVLLKLRSKPVNPDETFAYEKRALGSKKWKLRRRLNEILECIADLDRNKLEAKLPAKKQELLKYVSDLILRNSDTAHWSWGNLKMQTKIGRIPPASRMRPKHINRIQKGKKMYKPPKKYDPKDLQSSGRKWF